MASETIEVFSNEKKRTIIKQKENCFVIEGASAYLKWSLGLPQRVEFQYGPKIEVGKDFYGKGIVKDLEQVEPTRPDDKAIKVIIS